MIDYLNFIFSLFNVFISKVSMLWVRLSNPTSTFEQNVFVKGKVKNLKIGKRVAIQSGVVLHTGGKKWCEYSGRITIGDDGVISPNCVFYGAGGNGIEIGKNFDCGPFVGIYSSRTNYEEKNFSHVFKDVIIGDDVIIFSHAVIGPGVTIGDRAVIAAGSIVLKDVPSDCMVGGVPAVILKK